MFSTEHSLRFTEQKLKYTQRSTSKDFINKKGFKQCNRIFLLLSQRQWKKVFFFFQFITQLIDKRQKLFECGQIAEAGEAEGEHQ